VRRGCRLTEVGDFTQQLASMTERHPNFFEVLISQIRQDDKTDVIFGKALGVFSEPELLQPVGDLLHRSSAPDYRASSLSPAAPK
jgi:hypothetical protein